MEFREWKDLPGDADDMGDFQLLMRGEKIIPDNKSKVGLEF